VVPSEKFTVPVGVPPPEVTVAVKVTLLPEVMLLDEAATVVVVVAGVTLPPEPLPPEDPFPLEEFPDPPPQAHRDPANTRQTKLRNTFMVNLR
jgi:hypothetical protein